MKKTWFFAMMVLAVCLSGYAHAQDCGLTIKEHKAFDGDFPNGLYIYGFGVDKATLPDECREPLTNTLNEMITEDVVSIMIIGYASETGNSGHNSDLAQKRADTIYKFVETHLGNAFSKSFITTRSAGESEQNVLNDSRVRGEQERYRAVEVVFSYPQDTKKYVDIIYLKRLGCTSAGDLFKKYILHLRENGSDAEFSQKEIDSVIEQCKKQNPQLEQSLSVYQQISNISSQLTAIHNKFRDNVSVWKDAEGNFNTARLASDTIAGVVLGTTGALVTSHVVKKNQVENGFEDIKCTIGGQNVAGWGDQFRVGIQ